MSQEKLPPVQRVVEIEAETEKAYLLRMLERNDRFDGAWMGTATKSWFPKSQVKIEFTQDHTGQNIVVAVIQEWIATKNGFNSQPALTIQTDRPINRTPDCHIGDDVPYYYPNE